MIATRIMERLGIPMSVHGHLEQGCAVQACARHFVTENTELIPAVAYPKNTEKG